MRRLDWADFRADDFDGLDPEVVIALLPHILGAPHPEAVGSDVPPELASQFVAVSIAVSAMFWAVLGWLSATFYRRFGETP